MFKKLSDFVILFLDFWILKYLILVNKTQNIHNYNIMAITLYLLSLLKIININRITPNITFVVYGQWFFSELLYDSLCTISCHVVNYLRSINTYYDAKIFAIKKTLENNYKWWKRIFKGVVKINYRPRILVFNL